MSHRRSTKSPDLLNLHHHKSVDNLNFSTHFRQTSSCPHTSQHRFSKAKHDVPDKPVMWTLWGFHREKAKSSCTGGNSLFDSDECEDVRNRHKLALREDQRESEWSEVNRQLHELMMRENSEPRRKLSRTTAPSPGQ
uniref:uncharacterized protein LOC122783710 isoform X3 n=1 Tax=Solea senegalensis TaxID=28829 RepID=UPI001CD81D74|nr:uncharacterized protein LOC122783710 isoform X3 [Solea senegalensis]